MPYLFLLAAIAFEVGDVADADLRDRTHRRRDDSLPPRLRIAPRGQCAPPRLSTTTPLMTSSTPATF